MTSFGESIGSLRHERLSSALTIKTPSPARLQPGFGISEPPRFVAATNPPYIVARNRTTHEILCHLNLLVSVPKEVDSFESFMIL